MHRLLSSRPDLFNSFSANIPASVAELDKAFSAQQVLQFNSILQINFLLQEQFFHQFKNIATFQV